MFNQRVFIQKPVFSPRYWWLWQMQRDVSLCCWVYSWYSLVEVLFNPFRLSQICLRQLLYCQSVNCIQMVWYFHILLI